MLRFLDICLEVYLGILVATLFVGIFTVRRR